MTARFLSLLCAALLATACVEAPPVDVDALIIRDSTYFDATNLEPFSGRVFRSFPDDRETVQLEGMLVEGTWNGELTVYHPNGRIRFQGRLVDGRQCGAWVEDFDEEAEVSVYEEIRRQIETLVMYPECPD